MSGGTLMDVSMDTTYSSSEIQRIAKITKMQAIHWTQTGIIVPLQDAQGRGSRRVYSWENLIEMMICRELNKYGVEKWVMEQITHLMNEPALFSTQTGETAPYDNYWAFFKQNLKTDFVCLVITYLKVSEIRLGFGSILFGNRKETIRTLKSALNSLEETKDSKTIELKKTMRTIISKLNSLEETKDSKTIEKDQEQEKFKRGSSMPVSIILMRKTDIQEWAEMYSSFMVISIDKLFKEAGKR